MSKGEYTYPEDEFDAVERHSVPRGVHRAPRSVWTRAWPFLVVLVLAPALAYGAVTYWSMDHGAAPVAQASVQTPAASTAATPAQTPSATPSAKASAKPSATPSQTPAGVADRSTTVAVFNATTSGGLAGKAAKVLTDAGWKSVKSENYTGGKLASSTVFFGTAKLEATARGAADALGIKAVQLDATVHGLKIVLEDDYKP